MFSFLLGLLGLGYLGIRCADEKMTAAKYDEHMRQFKDAEDRYRKLFPPPELQEEIRKRVYSGEFFDEVCNELQEELSFIFGDNFKDTISIAPYKNRNPYEQKYSVVSKIVERLLLAKKGMAYYWDLQSGFYLGAKHIILCGVNEYDATVRAAQCFESLLHKSGATDIILEVEGNREWHNADGTLTKQAISFGKDDNNKWCCCKVKEKRSIHGISFRIW